jgi:SAM-dependent methyltransferase
MTATADGQTPGYTLDNTWRAARDRLNHLEAACDPLTERHLDKVGLAPGWRCLEVGAGGGSVTRMLCERVGPEGHVLAVDLELALLGHLSAPNLEVRRLDVVADELPEAAFDLVHTRAVLLHIAQRDDVLPKLVRSLKPGGVLLLEEVDLSPVFEGPATVWREAVVAMYRPLVHLGMDLFWAATLPEWLEAGGLAAVGGATERVTFTGGSRLAEFFRITFDQLGESQPYNDAERAAMTACHADFAQPGQEYVAWDYVAAWGRRP